MWRSPSGHLVAIRHFYQYGVSPPFAPACNPDQTSRCEPKLISRLEIKIQGEQRRG